MNDKKAKIIRIIARLNIGGPAIHTILLNSGLNKDGYKDILVSGRISGSEGDMLYLAREHNVEPVIIPELGREISLKNDLVALFKLYSFIRKERPDIVHTHTAKAGTLGRIVAVLAGVPVRIHTFHGHAFDGYFNPVKAKIFLMIERLLAFFTTRVIVVSKSVKNEIVDKLKVTKDEKCVVIPLGLYLEEFFDCENKKGFLRKELGIGDDTLLVGIVGRLVSIKNHKMFLEAAKDIAGRNIFAKIKFIIIGDGEMRSELEAYAKSAGIENIVIFTGWKKELSPVYADLDVVTLTSLNEGTPVSIIEAMASAKVVLATKVGGVEDLIIDGDNGFLAEPGNVRNFSDKLARILKDAPLRSTIGERARRSVRGKYSSERLVKDIGRLYDECLGRQP